MATESEHQQQATHNEQFLNAIDHTKYPDWFATVAFYVAVHLVQSLFCVSGDWCKSHQQRNDLLRRKFSQVWRQYQPLYAYSRLARYWCMKVSPDHVPYIRRRLGKVHSQINAEIARLKKKAS
ncbi:MAG: hypothetical protein HYS13_07935 [Planctomycetia bacterium]|nr:hypothetical protein [Planctomycetia bacterium]